MLTLARPRASRSAQRSPPRAAVVHVLPSLPASAVDLLRRPASKSTVRAVLESDPALAAAADAADVPAALARLGAAVVRRRAVQASVLALRQLLPTGAVRAAADRRAFATAAAAEALAEASGPATPLPPLEAWVAGALHDVGAVARAHAAGGRAALEAALDAESDAMSGEILRAWGLAQRIERAVSGRSDPRHPGAMLLARAHRLGLLVAAGELPAAAAVAAEVAQGLDWSAASRGI